MGKLKEKLSCGVHPSSEGSEYAEIRPSAACESGLALLELVISDIASSDQETASSALRSLSYFLCNGKCGVEISDKVAAAILSSICQLIISTDKKALCSLGVWCLSIQDLRPQLVEPHLELILQALLHAIDTPLSARALTHEALQALVKLARKFASVRVKSSVWAPAVYRRLLSADRKDREVAEQCMKDLELMTLLPPQLSLSKVVAVDINEMLLPRMEKMVKSKALVLPTVRAWGWFVRLLGGLAGENRTLVNQLLKIVELTFTSQDTSVRNASLVAWEALIDALLQPPVMPGPQNNAGLDMVSLSSGEPQKPYLAPPLKRLKLLMVPLVSIMSDDKDQAVRLACWRTWSYLAHKLGAGINQPSVANIVVTSIFEAMFKHGPDKGHPSAWDCCLNAFEDWICCKVQNKIDYCLSRALSINIPGKVPSPKTPTCRAPESTAEASSTILWAPWSLDILEVLLKLVKVLWDMGVKGLENSCTSNLSLNGALRMFLLVVKGVESDGKGAVKPSKQHIDSVHSLLRFASTVSCECVPTAVSRELFSAVWSVIESLLDLQPLVLSSSFYKLALAPVNFKIKPGQPCSTSCKFENGTGQQEITEFWLCESVTPVVYILAAWLQLGRTADLAGPDADFFIKRVESLVVFAISGFNIMGNLHGIASVLDSLLSEIYKQNTAGEADEELVTDDVNKEGRFSDFDRQNCTHLLHSWKVLAEHTRSYIERANDVPAVEGGVGDSGYQVIFSLLLFPLQVYLQLTSLSLSDNGNASLEVEAASAISGHDLEFVLTTWVKFFHCALHISSRMSSQPNSFASGLSQKILKLLEKQWLQKDSKEKRTANEGSLLAEMLAIVVADVLKQTEVSSLATLAINRKKRLGNFMGVSGTSGIRGSEADNASNVRDILSLASRVLDLSCEKFISGQAFWLDSTARVLEELARFAARLDLQHDVLMFLQVFSKPFAKWLKSTESFLWNDNNSSSSTLLLQALQKAWQKHLHSLQKCHPPLAFDSNLLSLQAGALAPAFQHSQTPISNCTVSFWEATYGSKASALNYPPCLVPVLGQLKNKVKVSLPGWNRGAAESSRRKSDVTSFTYTGRRWLEVFQEHLVDTKKAPQCMSVLGPKTTTHDQEIPSQAGCPSLPGSSGVIPETIKRPTASVFTSMEALQAGFGSSQTAASPSSCVLSKIKDLVQDADKESAALSIEDCVIVHTCSGPEMPTNFSEATFQGNAPPKFTAAPRRKNLRFLDLKTFAYASTPISEEGIFPMKQLEARMVRQGEAEGKRDNHSESSLSSEKPTQAIMSTDALNHSTETTTQYDTHVRMSKESRVRRTGEMMKLGIRQQRFLRSSGSLRGGKFWRDTSGTVKALQKIRKQAGSPPLISGIEKSTTEGRQNSTEEKIFAVQRVTKVGRPSLSRLMEDEASAEAIKKTVEKVHAEQVPRKRGRPRSLESANSKGAVEATQSTEGVYTVANAEDMGPQMHTSGEQCVDLGPSKAEKLLKKANMESPFRVQTLNRGLHGKIFSSVVKQSNAINGIASRSHHRKNSCPRRIPVSNDRQQDGDSQESGGACLHHKVKLGKRSKEAERQLGFGFTTPSKILRSGKRLKSWKWEAVAGADTYVNQGAHLGSLSHENFESLTCSLATASHLENVGVGVGTKIGLLCLGGSGNRLSSNLLQAEDQCGYKSDAGIVSKGLPTLAFERISAIPAGQKMFHETSSSMHTIVCLENRGVTSHNEFRTHEELVQHLECCRTCRCTKRKLCDVLADMASSSEWSTMSMDDLECAQKFLSLLQGIVCESKKQASNSHAEKV